MFVCCVCVRCVCRLMQGQYLTQVAYPTSWLSSPQFLLGLAVFLSGMTINIQSDNILMNLRKPGESGYKIPRVRVCGHVAEFYTVQEAPCVCVCVLCVCLCGCVGGHLLVMAVFLRVCVPVPVSPVLLPHQGGMFEYVSGANFFGEILEWFGFALACWSLPALAFALFTAFNTGPRGVQHHKNYLEKFKGEYPPQRAALIPFLL